MILIHSTLSILFHRVSWAVCQVSEDSQNRSEENVNLSAGTSPDDSTDSDPGSPSSHGLPPAATRARKKKNSDEEDSDFQPDEVTSKKSPQRVVVRKRKICKESL